MGAEDARGPRQNIYPARFDAEMASKIMAGIKPQGLVIGMSRGRLWSLKRRLNRILELGTTFPHAKRTYDRLRNPGWRQPSLQEERSFSLDLYDQDSTFTCTSERNVWGYVGDPSASNPPRLISVPAGVQAIKGGRYVSAETRFYTTDSNGISLHPYLVREAFTGLERVFKAFATRLNNTAYVVDDEIAVKSAEGNWLWAKCTHLGTTDPGSGTVSTHPDSYTVLGGTIVSTQANIDNIKAEDDTNFLQVLESATLGCAIQLDGMIDRDGTSPALVVNGGYIGNAAHYVGAWYWDWSGAEFVRLDDDAGDSGADDRFNHGNGNDADRTYSLPAAAFDTHGNYRVKFQHSATTANNHNFYLDKVEVQYTSVGIHYHDTDIGDSISDGTAIFEVQGYATLHQGGILTEGSATSLALYNRDLSNAAWVKTDCNGTKDATGTDEVSNSASTLTATGNNATCLQTVTIELANYAFSPYIKRKTGTGTVEITIDNGGTWTDITASLSTTLWTRFNTTKNAANPVFGFRIGTSGDEIEVDFAGVEARLFGSSPVATTSATAERAEAVLSDSSAGVISPAEWAIRMVVTPGGKHNGVIFSSTVGAEDFINVAATITSNDVLIAAEVGGVGVSASSSYTHAADVPYEAQFYRSSGKYSVRAFSVGAAESSWRTSAASDDTPLANLFVISKDSITPPFYGCVLSFEIAQNKEAFGW